MKPKLYKLTDSNLRTHNGFQWEINKWAPKTTGTQLCTSGVYHAYTDPSLALLLNPIHANIRFPRLWEVDYKGDIIDTDKGLKVGVNQMRLIREITYIAPTLEQRVTFALLCAKEVCKDPTFNLFADNWISGKDRTEKTAEEAGARAARAAEEAGARAARAAEAAAAAAAAWARARAAAAAAAWAAWAATANPKTLNLITLAQQAYPLKF